MHGIVSISQQKYVNHLKGNSKRVIVVIYSDFSGNELHIQMGVDRVIMLRSPGGVMANMLTLQWQGLWVRILL